MNDARVLASVVRNQLRNILRLATGVPLAPPPLAFSSLEPGDVEAACGRLAEDSGFTAEGATGEFSSGLERALGLPRPLLFASGREALSACLESVGLAEGDEVLLPGYTCVVVDNSVRFCGLTPVYCDIELDSYGLDVEDVARKISPRTRVLLIQHLYGLVGRDYQALVDLARRHSLVIIEDCAQAFGTRFQGSSVGSLADFAFFSFERSKTVTTVEGGAAFAVNPKYQAGLDRVFDATPEAEPERVLPLLRTLPLAYDLHAHRQRWWRGDLARIRMRATHLPWISAGQLSGARPRDYGRRLAGPLAALGARQLERLPSMIRTRESFVSQLALRLGRLGWTLPVIQPQSQPVILRFPVLVAPKQKRSLWKVEILSKQAPGVWFTSNLHPSQRNVLDCPRADEAVLRCVNFPTLPSGATSGGLPEAP